MDTQHSSQTLRSYRGRYLLLSVLLLLTMLLLVGTPVRSAHAAGVNDLLSHIPVVDENTVDNGACGRAAVTMLLDYYLLQASPPAQPVTITVVDQYVKENYRYDAKTGQTIPIGTNFVDVQTGLEAASAAPDVGLAVSLKASLQTTDENNWFSVLTSELDAQRPVILFIPDGGALGWNWHYGHYIVVSGYTSDGTIVYHDPWDGNAHSLAKDAFAQAWGTAWGGQEPWWYMQVVPPGSPLTPTASAPALPTPTPTNTQPNFAPFVGTWDQESIVMNINPDGTATYQGRVFVWCTDDPRPPCDSMSNGQITGGLDTQITFTSVSGNTASGTITGGTGDRDVHGNIIPVGSNLSVTLNPNGTLSVSDGETLCTANVYNINGYCPNT